MASRFWTRRNFLGGIGAGLAALSAGDVFAELLAATPQMTEGPFYPDKLPLDTDNDLIVVNDAVTPALGEITHLTGRILSRAGEPIRNAFVEIWQVDNNGVYLNSNDPRREGRDSNFQGYGRFLTDSKGQYYFRTIKPVPYPGRTPHIHFGISRNGKRIYTTQMFVKGHAQNDRDGIFRAIRDAAARESLQIEFRPIAESKIGELAANFDIVLGITPEDPPDAPVHGGVGPSQWSRERRS